LLVSRLFIAQEEKRGSGLGVDQDWKKRRKGVCRPIVVGQGHRCSKPFKSTSCKGEKEGRHTTTTSDLKEGKGWGGIPMDPPIRGRWERKRRRVFFSLNCGRFSSVVYPYWEEKKGAIIAPLTPGQKKKKTWPLCLRALGERKKKFPDPLFEI